MSELESLTKTLIHVVGSLQDLLSKKSTSSSTLQPEPPKPKFTSQMTYNEFVKKVLSGRKAVQVSSKKSSFKLQQDLQLLSQLSNRDQISLKTFEQISKSKRINRTPEALKSRYNEQLEKIGQKQMKQIVSWIQRQGIDGYIVFENQQMKIQINDPSDKKDDKKRNKVVQSQGRKQQKNKKTKAVPVNCKQLNEVLKLYSKMVNIPVKSLVQKLDQLSGDLVQLDNYIQTKDARMLWTPEQDQILVKGGAQLEILKRYRGNGVQIRKKYLGL